MWTRLRPSRPEPPGGPAPRRLRRSPRSRRALHVRWAIRRKQVAVARRPRQCSNRLGEPATLVIGAMRSSGSCARTSRRRSMNVTGCGPWQRHLAGMSYRMHGSARDEPIVDRRAGLEPGVLARFRPAFRRTPALGRSLGIRSGRDSSWQGRRRSSSSRFQDPDRLVEESSKIERSRPQEYLRKHGVLIGMSSGSHQLARTA